MSPRKTILRELSRAHSTAAPAYTRPTSITGFSDAPERYQKAVNELLKARLLEGRKDDEGHMTIALNEARRDQIDRELRPLWAHPGLWVAVVLILVLGVGIAV